MSVSVDCPFIDSVYVSDDSEPAQHMIQDIPEQLLQSHGLTSKDWRKAQLDDPTLSVIVRSLETGLPAPLKRDVDPAFDTSRNGTSLPQGMGQAPYLQRSPPS